MKKESSYAKCPKEFISGKEPYKSLSLSARFIYITLSDSVELSEKNKAFQDEDGTPFVCYTVEELSANLGIGTATVTRAFKELEDIGLISRVRQYACQPNKIYVHPLQNAKITN